ncbi:alpha/beta fold hydrolase [Streptomyces sp. NPDC056373]|uniref:alpha/beta fold hydrolase n=1 Tax=Streptomyces sp. NPDC056373 TaxID=3345798 RepID=UPI0035DE07DA
MGQYSIERSVRDLAAFVDPLGKGEADVLGFSSGGVVLTRALADLSVATRLHRAIIADPGLMDGPTAQLTLVPFLPPRLRLGVPERAAPMTCRRHVHRVRRLEGEFVDTGTHQPHQSPYLGSQPLPRPAFLECGPLGEGTVRPAPSERVDLHRATDQVRLRPSGLSRRIGEGARAVPKAVENHRTPGGS